MKELDGGDSGVRQKLRKQRMQARSLCTEIELELNSLSRAKAKLNIKTAKKLTKLNEVFQNICSRIDEIEKMARDLGASSILLGCMYFTY